jgi:Domain of unknown function (DUF4258)
MQQKKKPANRAPPSRAPDVACVIAEGKEVESYPDDKPYPSRLWLGWVNKRPIHVVTATAEHEIIVITVYEPDPACWESGFERRRGQ